VLLSLLFVLVYGSTNWFTAIRPASEVRTWYFPWELKLTPYVPALIVPYMSLDLLFFLAAFLCHDRREIHLFERRVIFAILVAAGFFLAMPLKLAWPDRPQVNGWFGHFVEASVTAPFLMEYPHNLFPALHITLSLLVGDVYARHSRGIVRLLLVAWFVLIGLSTILTWQHHLVDLAGGWLLGVFALYLFREPNGRLPVVAHVRVGSYYAAACILGAVAAVATWPWGVFLFWPTAAFGLTALAYFGLGPGVFQKTAGRLSWSARFVLAPVFVGQHLSLVYYRWRCAAWHELAPGLLIGRMLNESEAADAIRQGVTAVLDLTAEFSAPAAFRAARYRNMPVLDLTRPTSDQLREAVQFLSREAAAGTVYLHCKVGYSRSAAVAGAYLLANRLASTPEEAVKVLRRTRPSIIIRPEALEAIREFARERATERPGESSQSRHNRQPATISHCEP
jgi:protein-tyrosine phosphatase/membrane-associated phospholipid phosphatase